MTSRKKTKAYLILEFADAPCPRVLALAAIESDRTARGGQPRADATKAHEAAQSNQRLSEPEATVVVEPHSAWLIEQEHNGVSRWAVIYHGADATKVERWTLSASAATKYDTRDDALDVLPLIVDDYPSREITVTEHVFDSGPTPYEHALPPKTNDWRDRPLTVGMMVDAMGHVELRTRNAASDGRIVGVLLAKAAEELERIAKGGAR